MTDLASFKETFKNVLRRLELAEAPRVRLKSCPVDKRHFPSYEEFLVTAMANKSAVTHGVGNAIDSALSARCWRLEVSYGPLRLFSGAPPIWSRHPSSIRCLRRPEASYILMFLTRQNHHSYTHQLDTINDQ
jgi:hypothetical protein